MAIWVPFVVMWTIWIFWDLIIWSKLSLMGKGWYFISYRLHFCYWTPSLFMGDDSNWYDVKVMFHWFRTGIEFAWHKPKRGNGNGR